MLRASIAFFAFALFAFILGANGIALLSVEIGRTLLWVFLTLAVLSGIVHMISGRPPKNLL